MTTARTTLCLLLFGQVILPVGCGGSRQPLQVVAGHDGIAPAVAALDETSLYWVEIADDGQSTGNGRIMRLPKSTPGSADAEAIGVGKRVIAAGGVVWWTQDSSTLIVSRRDAAGNVAVLFERGEAIVKGFARNAHSLYVAFVDIALGAWQLHGIPLDGTAPVLLASQNVGTTEFGEVTADDRHVYWAIVPPIGQSGQAEIRRIPVGGSAVETFASDVAIPLRLFVDADNVYWFGASVRGLFAPDGMLLAKPTSGEAVSELAVVTGFRAMAVDADSLYWSGADRTIMKLALSGESAAVFRSFGPEVIDVADIMIDERDVYWSESDTGSAGIMRAAKR